jgi:hypothetical protein
MEKKTIEQRFWEKVDTSLGYGPNGDCWKWTGVLNNMGYGQLLINGRMKYSHRYSYQLRYGSFPDAMRVLHKCDNPRCCNPEHLFLGTQMDNVHDMMAKGRQNYVIPIGSKHGGSKLNEVEVIKIRRRYELGERQVDIARDYNVNKTTINVIVHRKKWKHI